LNAWLLYWLNSTFQLATNGLMSSILTALSVLAALVLGAMLVVMLAETGGRRTQNKTHDRSSIRMGAALAPQFLPPAA
jgi:hypothetical protein